MADRFLFVGLGNPGKKYSKNRHNAGFIAVDSIAESLGAGPFTKDKRGEWARAEGTNKSEIFFYKPLEFMNLSGGGVRDFTKKYPVETARVVVLHDEIELPFGEVRWKVGGGHKGHNGLRDLIAKCGSPDFHRIRLGVGRPDDDDVAEYVLSDFTPDQMRAFPEMTAKAQTMIQKWLEDPSKAPAG